MNIDKKLYFFIHIPRTSGTFIKQSIKKTTHKNINIIFYENYKIVGNNQNNIIKEHISIFNLKKKITKDNLNKIQFFTIVRNPYERLYSLWKFFSNNVTLKIQLDIDFIAENYEDFVYEYYQGYYDGYYIFQPQTYFLRGENIENIKIIKYEDRNKINDFLCQNNVENFKDIINQSSKKFLQDYHLVYNDSMKEMVYIKLKDEFTSFGYFK